MRDGVEVATVEYETPYFAWMLVTFPFSWILLKKIRITSHKFMNLSYIFSQTNRDKNVFLSSLLFDMHFYTLHLDHFNPVIAFHGLILKGSKRRVKGMSEWKHEKTNYNERTDPGNFDSPVKMCLPFRVWIGRMLVPWATWNSLVKSWLKLAILD